MATGTALVTGASSGLGAAFADRLATEGRSLLLVARSQQRLEEQAERLRHQHGVPVRILPVDLADAGQRQAMLSELAASHRDVDLLINNAGVAAQGPFEQIDWSLHRSQLRLNMEALTELTYAVLEPMLARGQGGVLHVASLGAFQPAPRLATYGASKAFVLSFSQALSAELRPRGVAVCALCPGPVATSFFERLGSADAAIGQQLTPDQVASAGLRGLRSGRTVVVPGRRNSFTAAVSRRLPMSLALAAANRATRRIATPTPA